MKLPSLNQRERKENAGKPAPVVNDRRFRRRMAIRDNLPFYVMLIIPTLFFIAFCYLPLFGIIIAFQDFKVGSTFFGDSVKWVGLKWFKQYFTSMFFGRTIKNTIVLNIIYFLLLFPLPIFLAVIFNEIQKPKLRGFVQTVSYLPYFLSVTIVVGIMKNLLDPTDGLVNIMLKNMGLQAYDFMGSAQWFRPLWTFSEAWQNAGFSSVVYIAAIAGISPELYEAAFVDGSTRCKNVWYITLPCIAPTIIILLVLQMGTFFSVGYEKIILMYSPTTYETADVISTYVYRNGIGSQKFSFATAIDLFNSLINVTVLLIANMFAKRFSETSLF